MEVVICQNCGNVLKTRARTCQSCSNLVSRFGSTALPGFSSSSKALAVQLVPDPDVLERVWVKQSDRNNGLNQSEISQFLAQRFHVGAGNDNGHNGASANGHASAEPVAESPGNRPIVDAQSESRHQALSERVEAVRIPPTEPEAQPVADNQADNAKTRIELKTGSQQDLVQDPVQNLQQETKPENGSPFGPFEAQPPPPPAASRLKSEAPAPSLSDQIPAGTEAAKSELEPEPPETAVPAPSAVADQSANLSSVKSTPTINVVSASATAPITVQSLPSPGPSPGMTIASVSSGSSRNSDISGANMPPVSSPQSNDFFGSLAAAGPPPAAPAVTSATIAGAIPFETPMPVVQTNSTSHSHDDFFSSAPFLRNSDHAPHSPPNRNVNLNGPSTVLETAMPLDPLNQEDSDPNLHKRVSAPLGYQKRATPTDLNFIPPLDEEPKPVHNPELDENGDHSSSQTSNAPHRRSFSGKDKASGNHGRRREDKESGREENKPSKSRQWTNREFEIFGKKLNAVQAVIAGVVVAVFVFCTVNLFVGVASQLISGLTGGSGGSTSPLDHLPGRWKVRAVGKKFDVRGELLMHQRGNQVFGEGRDNSPGGGYFQFSGDVKGSGDIDFVKQYVRGSDPVGKPVQYHGLIMADKESGAPFAQGDWTLHTSTGMGWRHTPITITGAWEALQVQANAHDDNSMKQVAVRTPTGDLSQMGLKAAFFFIFLAIAIFVLARKFFGPDGWNNQLTTRRYIPSQFVGEHKKDVRELSQGLKAGSVPFGQRCEWHPLKPWEAKDIALTPAVRKNNPHILMVGAGDKGKSRLMAKMIAHDIESGDRAVCVIDSDGSLSEVVTRWIAHPHNAAELAKRVTILDPTFDGGCLSYNPMAMPDDGDLQGAASAVVYGFKAIYSEPPGSQSQWNAQTANILRNSALLLMMNNKTLTDLPTLLQENDFRDVLLEVAESRRRERVEYATLLETWGTYKRLARTDQWITWVEPILNRVTTMLSDPRIRPILTQEKGDIDLKQIIREKRILIVRIPQGQLDQNANLLGSLLVTGLKQAALSLSIKDKQAQNPVALYLDEFDNFIEKETFDAITSETKKFSIGFIGATKSLQDFPEDFRNQLVINVGSMACFSLSKKDGDMLGPTMFRVDGRKKKHETLQNFFNPINTSPQFELISDEEKLNIDRVVGQAERTFYLYRVGTVAGVFHLKSHPFNDVADKHIDRSMIEKMHGVHS